MERWRNRVAVVTGASSGIGAACAQDLVKAGLRVVALARRVELLNDNRSKLPAECQTRFYPRKCDISNEAEVKQTFEWIDKTLGGTDVLVNNAGCLREGDLLEMDSKLMDDVWNTNVKGLIYCTQAAYRSMKRRDFAGHIVHINSIAGHKVTKFGEGSFNVYPASKFAVTAINETIRLEFNQMSLKIKTTSINPGVVATEILTPEQAKQFGERYLKPSDISNAVMFAISTPPNVMVTDLTVKPVGETF